MQRKILAAAIFALFASFSTAHSQSTSPVLLPNGCGTGNATNSLSYLTIDSTGKLCDGSTLLPSALSSAALTPSPASPALATAQIIKAAPGNLYSFEVSADSTLSGTAWWILVYDALTDPGNGTVTPRKCYAQISGTTSASYTFPTPIAFGTGIVIVASTTGCYTETQSAHAFISGDAK